MVSFSKDIKKKFRSIGLKNNFILWIGLGLIIVLFVLILLVKKPKTVATLILNEYKSGTPTFITTTKSGVMGIIEKDKFELPASTNPEIVDLLKTIYLLIIENGKVLSFESEIEASENHSMTWSTEDGRKIIDINSPGLRWLSVRFGREEMADFKLKVLLLIESEFIKSGFVKDAENSGDYPDYKGEFDLFYSGYYVFNKNDIKCIISVEPDTTKPTGISMVCSDQYKKNYETQTKIVNSLGSELDEHAKARPLSEVVLFDRYGIFRFFGPGQSFLVTGMMDANDKWHILWQGFTGDGLPCELLDEHPMFKEYYSTPYCYYREGKRTGEYVEWD